jgi:ankyrin repeat protein
MPAREGSRSATSSIPYLYSLLRDTEGTHSATHSPSARFWDASVAKTVSLLPATWVGSRATECREIQPLTSPLVRYTPFGVSDASESAGKAEPTDDRAHDNLKTDLLFCLLRGLGNARKEEMVVPRRLCYPAPTRRLPQHPNLEQLRKQAKDLLARYRSDDSAAIAEIERFAGTPDPSTFALHDAQRVLARAYGYENWPKLKAFVDGVNIARFTQAVKAGNLQQVQSMLASRPELIAIDTAESDEHRALHFAVLRRDAAMVRLLMRAGADARKGIWPHRDATSALAIARDREYPELLAVIEEEELRRSVELSCPNATISPLQDQIYAAISHGDTQAAIRLVGSDLSLIHACDRTGATPLHIAAESANVELVSWLLERGAGVRKPDLNGFTPLDRAALAADPRNRTAQRFPLIAELFLERGAELTIYAAVALADAPRIRELIHASPDLLRQIRSGGGLLTVAVIHGHIDAVRLLLDLGADVDERMMLEEVEQPTPTWGMPLWYAALAGRLDIAKLLLDRGADPNANVYASGWPLRNAWIHKHEAVKQLLLDRGAKIHPYMVAEFHDVPAAGRLLAADPSEDLARELVWSAADHGCPQIIELALSRLPWPASDYRWHWILIQPIRGARANSSENDGHFRCMAALLQYGMDANVARFGQTALHFTAAHHGPVSDEDRARFASMLLDHGARLDLRDDLLKSTPLGWACRWGRPKLAELLIQRGAVVHEPDAEPWATPIAWATKMKRESVLEILR